MEKHKDPVRYGVVDAWVAAFVSEIASCRQQARGRDSVGPPNGVVPSNGGEERVPAVQSGGPNL